MLFSSTTFIFLFLPIVSATYLLARKEIRNNLLLLASLFFYAWGEPRYLLIMLLTILINYVGANYISRSKNDQHRKILLVLSIIADLGCLFYFKYFNFFIENLNNITHLNLHFIDVVMPIGISFYTFQAMSYLIDVYRCDVKAQKSIYNLALYITLFPQLIAGPIVKYHDVEEQISNRDSTFEKVSYGIKRFIIGLSKKMIIANTLGVVADQIFSAPAQSLDTPTAWLGAITYSLQLFYDFSGYSDMAIGLGSIFGFKFLENFNYPYISKSITEFWRRWHISLSTWFKEYLYIPLGGNRVSKNRTYLNLLIVFLATGFWHGAAWNFIVWGLWHGFFIVLEKITGWHKMETKNIFHLCLKHLYASFVFIIGWVMFRAENMTYAFHYIQNMFGLTKIAKLQHINGLDVQSGVVLVVALVCATPIFHKMLDIPYKHKILRSLVNIWLMFLFIISLSIIANATYNPFIYFRF